MDSEQLLGHVSLFQRLDKKHVRQLARLMREQQYVPGQVIVQEGQSGLGLYIIAEGSAEVLRGDTILRTLNTGDFFGEMSLLDDLPRTASVRAAAPTRCLTLTKWEFLGELESHPQMALPLLPMLSRRVRAAEERADHLRGELTRES
ncbi:MAG TPA: cyclic nucleotide-binding domain-containing protein [Chloroflexota bacterium]|jgi:CRP-like cAMP-binding protein|nr:cyclic nucleotide-binding domain-containing protein [Chloroflexota bacterium]